MDDLAIRAREHLVKLGILEDSGIRRRNPDGENEIVWQLSRLAHMVSDYQERLGLTFEQALAKITAVVPGETAH